MNAEYLKEIFGINGIELPDEKIDKLVSLARMLKSFNEKINITAVTSDAGIAVRHFADSLAGTLKILGNVSRETLADVGAGGGFPSLPLAIAYDGITVTAIDSTAKKLSFVEEVSRELELKNIRTAAARAEDLGRDTAYRESFGFVTARAVGPLPVISELCIPLLRIGGAFIAYKGPDAPSETAAAERALKKLGAEVEGCESFSLSGEENSVSRTLVTIKKKARTGAEYPRNYSQIKKKPL